MSIKLNTTYYKKSEIKIIKSDYNTDDKYKFEDEVNRFLKEGWSILSSACSAHTFFDQNMVIHRHSYTAILFKETWKET